MKNIKTRRVTAFIVCVLIATIMCALTVYAQMCATYKPIQFIATFVLDYGFMFIVWLLIDELLTNKNKIQ